MTPVAVDFLGFGKYVSKTVETNAEVAARFGIAAEEIVARTGVGCRYIARDESASDMALAALNEAIADAALTPQDLSGVIVCTFSGDYIFPNTASRLCGALGISDCFAFDLQANCAGFQAGMAVARDMLLADPNRRPVAVVGVARQSPYLDPSDINTAFFFTDAAAATILGNVPGPGGLLSTVYKTNAKNYEVVRLRAGGSSHPPKSFRETGDPKMFYYEHAGLAVWKEVITELPALIKKTLVHVDWERREVELLLMHQANLRLIEYIMSRCGLDMSKTVTNIGEIGNTADASLGTVIHDAARQCRFRPGMKVILASVGAGFVYAVTPYLVSNSGWHARHQSV